MTNEESPLKFVPFQKQIVAVAALSLIVGMGAVRGRADTPAGSFASVDMEEVAKNSTVFTKNNADLKTFVDNLQGINARLGEGSAIFLPNAQLIELESLYEKTGPSDADKKRIAELEGIVDARKGEVSRLESTATPTDDQKKRYRELTDLQTAGKDNLTKLVDGFRKRISDREEELTAKTLKTIRAAIADVAKSKSISLVFDSKVAIYSANDITPDVIKQVNK